MVGSTDEMYSGFNVALSNSGKMRKMKETLDALAKQAKDDRDRIADLEAKVDALQAKISEP